MKSIIELDNSIFWDRRNGNKIYMEHVAIMFEHLPFTSRQVFLRFGSGPDMDLTTADMDRIVFEYLKMRTVSVSAVRETTCDTANEPRRMQKRNRKKCARCRRKRTYSDDWYGDLCPRCADRTDGDWVCLRCGRRGSFEAMGGDGADDPVCCGTLCRHT